MRPESSGERRWRQRLGAASRRVGGNHAQRLTWLLTLAQRDDPLATSSQEWRDISDDLYAFSLRSGFQLPSYTGSRSDTAPPALSPEQIRAIHATLRAGLRALFAGSGGWSVPLRTLTRYVFRRDNGRLETRYGGDVPAAVPMTAADLLGEFGDRVRKCSATGCTRIFLAVKRQAYCSPRCSQGVRTQKFLAAHRDVLNARRRQHYAQVLKAKGAKVQTYRRHTT